MRTLKYIPKRDINYLLKVMKSLIKSQREVDSKKLIEQIKLVEKKEMTLEELDDLIKLIEYLVIRGKVRPVTIGDMGGYDKRMDNIYERFLNLRDGTLKKWAEKNWRKERDYILGSP